MARILTVELTNGTVIQELVPEIAKEEDNEDVLARLAAGLTEALKEGIPFIVFGGQLLAIDKVVEAYVQES